MGNSADSEMKAICARYGNEATRMMDILREVQHQRRCVSDESVAEIACALGVTHGAVASTVSFYSFFSAKPVGTTIRLCDDIIDRFHGGDAVAEAWEQALGIGVGETTADGTLTLLTTPCIGMCDQAPAALINDTVFTRLTPERSRRLARELQEGRTPEELVDELGDGNNADDLVQAMVQNQIRLRDKVLLSPLAKGSALEKALALTPAEVIRNIKTARLRGRGGAGFPTGMKWEFTARAAGDRRFLVCNADEGEPGTFKDRVLLTEYPDTLLEGMTIGGYAIGAAEGIIYLRAEYAYLAAFLEAVLQGRRDAGLLGKNILGKPGFDFDVRIQLGAGAYICGEESALLNSCEGLRGDPRTRPPFPAQKGYLGCPTSVNNVETLCCVARILDESPGWFNALGSTQSAGTKLLSISGDCKRPGVYEVPFGITLGEVLKLAGATEIGAVQIGGPSGSMVGPDALERTICFDDLATGGSLMVFNNSRDILEIVEAFLAFFVHESCGYCTPCRVGNQLLLQLIGKVRTGEATADDLSQLSSLSETVKMTSRCGLGQTSPNPVVSTLEHFQEVYTKGLVDASSGLQPDFDLGAAVAHSAALVGRAAEDGEA